MGIRLENSVISGSLVSDLQTADPEIAVAGGKGANLATLTRAGFRVPPGFVVTTTGYHRMLDSGLSDHISDLVESTDFSDSASVDSTCATIRAAIESARYPQDLADDIAAAYADLGDDVRVAVRSSGTAEDLADTSFAGLHDTYLDIVGADAVLDAARRCWASMWSARATTYRHAHGFDQSAAALAVVIQQMVAADIAGVLFTTNPRTAATDEIVINSSWGLGETVVSGDVTPDEFVVKANTMTIVDRHLGSKKRRIDRASGPGTVTTDVGPADAHRNSLQDHHIIALARLGRNVEDHYGGIPQDIEWALADDKIYLLQSRPVTGVSYSWDAEIDGWQSTPEDDAVVWTRAMSDEMWNGAKTPLFYSIRASLWQLATDNLVRVWGVKGAEGAWFWKFHKGEAYFNTSLQRALTTDACPPLFRAFNTNTLAPDDRDGVSAAPFNYWKYLRGYVAHELEQPHRGFVRWLKYARQRADETTAQGRRFLAADIVEMTDAELRNHIDATIACEGEYWHDVWVPFFVYFRDMSGLLASLVASWYDGENPYAVVELMSGTSGDERSFTMAESDRLGELAETLRRSPELARVFDEFDAETYLDALAQTEDGREWVERYRAFVDEFPHRGSTDRDMYFPRRSEDPALDFRAMRALLSATDTKDPLLREKEINARREVVVEDVVGRIRRKPFGAMRAEVFTYVHDYVLRSLMFREDSRVPTDMTVLATKRACSELGRRLVERGLLGSDDDVHFLAKHELYELADGTRRALSLSQQKVHARRADFEALVTRRAQLPTYLKRGSGTEFADRDAPVSAGEWAGSPTSRGRATGTARVLHSLDQIGQLTPGDVLVCPATDPGWTPVFGLISGLVLESGGLLAHGSCLSREYGLPCIQLPRATSLIPDGARVVVDGETGFVRLADDNGSGPPAC